MKNRGKLVISEQEKPKFISNSNYFSSSSDRLCKKHPSNSSSVGICAYCLSEKLIKLVCSDCGEQRISSCYCSGSGSGSGFSSYRNSSCTVDVGSIGRVSCLIENETGSNRNDPKSLFSHLKLKQSETEDVVIFKRSNSCVVEVKKNYGFWKIGKFFNKKREKEGSSSERNRNRVGLDQESDVSRSRSLSSFMGDKFHKESCSIACSSAKISDFNGGLIDMEGGFRVKETDFGSIDDDDEFIDLEIELSDNSKTEHSVFKKCDLTGSGGGGGGGGRDDGDGDGGDMNIKKVKSWKWNIKHHSGNNDHNHVLKS